MTLVQGGLAPRWRIGRGNPLWSDLDRDPSYRQEGTGLGLYICQKLATLLGGRMTFESDTGKGSTFMLVIGAKVPPPLSNSLG